MAEGINQEYVTPEQLEATRSVVQDMAIRAALERGHSLGAWHLVPGRDGWAYSYDTDCQTCGAHCRIAVWEQTEFRPGRVAVSDIRPKSDALEAVTFYCPTPAMLGFGMRTESPEHNALLDAVAGAMQHAATLGHYLGSWRLDATGTDHVAYRASCDRCQAEVEIRQVGNLQDRATLTYNRKGLASQVACP